jgi:ribosome-binding factor A
MRTHRPLRMGSVIREELGKLFLREVNFGGAIVTITEVIVDANYAWADVSLSVLPAASEAAVLRRLAGATGHLHHLLNKKMNIRPMPMLRFKIDRGVENAARVEKLLADDDNKETA